MIEQRHRQLWKGVHTKNCREKMNICKHVSTKWFFKLCKVRTFLIGKVLPSIWQTHRIQVHSCVGFQRQTSPHPPRSPFNIIYFWNVWYQTFFCQFHSTKNWNGMISTLFDFYCIFFFGRFVHYLFACSSPTSNVWRKSYFGTCRLLLL